MEQLLKKLGSRSATIREAAIRQASALPYEDFAQLFELYRKRRRRDNVRSNTVSAICFILWYGWILLFLLYPGARLWWAAATDVDIAQAMLFFSLSGLVLAFASLLPSVKELLPHSASSSILTLLTETQDPRAVGLLLTFTPVVVGRSRVREVRQALHETVMRLLPQVSEDDAMAWAREQRQALTRCLRMSVFAESDPGIMDYLLIRSPAARFEMQLAVLRALQQFGDQRELDLVRRIAEMDARTPRQIELKQAALECLPHIERRAQEVQHTQTLLRPSDASAPILSETLLRPSADSTATPSEQLLRSTPQD